MDAKRVYGFFAKKVTVNGASFLMIVIPVQGDTEDGDVSLYPMGRLEAMFWCDDRLIRCVKVTSTGVRFALPRFIGI